MERSTEAKKHQVAELTRLFLQQILETTEHLPLPIRAHLSKILYPHAKINRGKLRTKLCSVCAFDLLDGSLAVAERKKSCKKILSIKCLVCSSSLSKVRFGGPARKKNKEAKIEASKITPSSFCNTPPNICNASRNGLSTGRRRFKGVEKLQRLAEMNKPTKNDSPLNSSLSSFLIQKLDSGSSTLIIVPRHSQLLPTPHRPNSPAAVVYPPILAPSALFLSQP